MRLPPDEELAFATVRAAADAGVTAFDTARAYGAAPGDLGNNERLVSRALRAAGVADRARIVTKGGMTRPGGAWVPDGRAKALTADCEASLEALDGLPIDLYLIHAPDPRTPWRTSVRALGRLAEQELVHAVGVANVNRKQLDEAVELAPIAAVQVALSPFNDDALRGGVVDRCSELSVTLIAHSPLGGPRRAATLARRGELTDIAARHRASEAEAALAWLLGVSPEIVAIPGARRPETARSAARAGSLELDDDARATLTRAFGFARQPARRPAHEGSLKTAGRDGGRGDVVIVMGIPGAGKTRLAREYADRGYVRLNRDERGGSLRALASELDGHLGHGVRRAVLDNTYLTRAHRSLVLDTAQGHAVPVRCVWLDTPLAQAQANLVRRLIDRFGSLPTPEQVREAGRRQPWLMLPTAQMRAMRELEPPAIDEGFDSVEVVPFARSEQGTGRPGVFVGAAAVARNGIANALADGAPTAPHLLFDWTPDGESSALRTVADRVASAITGTVEVAVCPHGGGPPSCWCRPPLPGLPLAFALAHSIDPSQSILIGCSSAHRTLATTLGARYIAVGDDEARSAESLT